MYLNYRCRKCGQILSVKIPDDYNYRRINEPGTLATSQNHPTCNAGIAEDEQVFCDLVSVSESQLTGSMLLIRNK